MTDDQYAELALMRMRWFAVYWELQAQRAGAGEPVAWDAAP